MKNTEAKITIHWQRISQEKVFQYLVKCGFFGKNTIEELRLVANRITTIVRNDCYNEDHIDLSNSDNLISDENANSIEFVINLIEKAIQATK